MPGTIPFAWSMSSSKNLIWPSLGLVGVDPEATGRPSYHPSILLKLYIYGYLNRVQSSRRLEYEAGRNVEVMWLLGRLVPDHKTHRSGSRIRTQCAGGARVRGLKDRTGDCQPAGPVRGSLRKTLRSPSRACGIGDRKRKTHAAWSVAACGDRNTWPKNRIRHGRGQHNGQSRGDCSARS